MELISELDNLINGAKFIGMAQMAVNPNLDPMDSTAWLALEELDFKHCSP